MQQLICHTLQKHCHDGTFMAFCTIGSCMYSTKSASAYKIHLRRHHPEFPRDLEFGTVLNVRDQGEYSSLDDDEVFNEEEYQTIALPDDGHLQKKSFIMLLAKYFLSLENDHRATKFSVDNIAISTRQLLSTVLSVLIDKSLLIILYQILKMKFRVNFYILVTGFEVPTRGTIHIKSCVMLLSPCLFTWGKLTKQ